MKKINFWLWLQIISALIILTSKLFLIEKSYIGWILASVGYVLVVPYNIKRKMKVLAIVVGGLAALTTYGLIKWMSEQKGLFLIDYSVMALIFIGAVSLTLYQSIQKKKEELWQLQLIATIFFIVSYMSLGYHYYLVGWMSMMMSHVIIGYIYLNKESYWFFGVQGVSYFLAGYAVYDASNIWIPIIITCSLLAGWGIYILWEYIQGKYVKSLFN